MFVQSVGDKVGERGLLLAMRQFCEHQLPVWPWLANPDLYIHNALSVPTGSFKCLYRARAV